MEYSVSLKNLPRQYAAVARFRAVPAQMPSKMPAAFEKVSAFLAAAGVPLEGPAIARFREAGGAFDVEAGFYVPAAFAPGDDVTCIELPAGEAAVTTHLGPYEDLSAAYQALERWTEAQGRQPGEPMWEEYWSPPTAPPSEWRTDVIWPLKPAA